MDIDPPTPRPGSGDDRRPTPPRAPAGRHGARTVGRRARPGLDASPWHADAEPGRVRPGELGIVGRRPSTPRPGHLAEHAPDEPGPTTAQCQRMRRMMHVAVHLLGGSSAGTR